MAGELLRWQTLTPSRWNLAGSHLRHGQRPLSIAVYIQNQICKLSVSLICADSVLVMYCGWESRGQSPLRVIQKGRAPLVPSAQDRPPRRSAACIRPADGTRPADSLESDRFDRREKLIRYGLRPYISAPLSGRRITHPGFPLIYHLPPFQAVSLSPLPYWNTFHFFPASLGNNWVFWNHHLRVGVNQEQVFLMHVICVILSDGRMRRMIL